MTNVNWCHTDFASNGHTTNYFQLNIRMSSRWINIYVHMRLRLVSFILFHALFVILWLHERHFSLRCWYFEFTILIWWMNFAFLLPLHIKYHHFTTEATHLKVQSWFAGSWQPHVVLTQALRNFTSIANVHLHQFLLMQTRSNIEDKGGYCQTSLLKFPIFFSFKATK